jgi:glutamyl-tRNA(Gln) amidotransferase subunit E
MDEEPPGPLNAQAVEIALTVAMMIGAKPVEEVQVMRKIVIDGSNTTGFQRTCVIALGGKLRTETGEIGIQQISLEEDAARKTGEDRGKVSYRLDRLGIPLIEVSTAPDVNSPRMAQEVALSIGNVLKSTRGVKRGLGTIRQDLNVSIREGALIEIKGVQELELIAKVVEYEVARQLSLLKIKEDLKGRGLTPSDFGVGPVDCTSIFSDSKSKVIRTAITGGGVVKAILLRKFGGLLGRELCPNVRLGTEFAGYASFWGRVGGIFHTDELPDYGIAEGEIAAARKLTGAGSEDAVVIVADLETNVNDAIQAVVDRAREAAKGVPEETRAAQPDGTTRYMRPRPGAARMYPETDVPSFPVTSGLLERIRRNLPPPRETIIRELTTSRGLSAKLADELADSEHLILFNRLVKLKSVPTGFLASALVEGLTSLRREGVPVDLLTEEVIYQTFVTVANGKITKESVLDVLAWLARNPRSGIDDALRELKLEMIDRRSLEQIVQKHVDANKSLALKEKDRAFGVIMSRVMGEVRGRADAKLVSELIAKKIGEL